MSSDSCSSCPVSRNSDSRPNPPPPPLLALEDIPWFEPPPPQPGIFQPNLTGTVPELPLGHVRREEPIPADSPEYAAGQGIEHRVRSPPPEVAGDPWDRQRTIVGWNQSLIERQRCLVLGTGGVGQNVALGLARSGVAEITLIDCDSLEASNLSRQCLALAAQLGRPKTFAAAESLFAGGHQIRSRVRCLQVDALSPQGWPLVVAAARQCDAVFNCADAGSAWDFAVAALAKELRLPLLQGQSYSWFCNAEAWSGRTENLCGACSSGALRSEFRLVGEREISGEFGLLRALAEASENFVRDPGSGRFLLDPPGLCRFFAEDARFRCGGPVLLRMFGRILGVTKGVGERVDEAKEAAIVDTISQEPEEDWVYLLDEQPAEGVEGDHESEEEIALRTNGAGGLVLGLVEETRAQDTARLRTFLQAWHRRSLRLLLPGGPLSRLPELRFLPRPKAVPTRFFGSWYGPCMMVGVLMVSQWANLLTGPSGRNPPVSVSFQLDRGMTDAESLAYDTGMALRPEDRPMAGDPSAETCAVCRAAQRLHGSDDAGIVDLAQSGGEP